MAGGAGPIQSKLKEKEQAKVIGQEYKAKMASVDVMKKGCMDPCAYVGSIDITLEGPKGGLGLTNKSKAEKRKNYELGRRSWSTADLLLHHTHRLRIKQVAVGRFSSDNTTSSSYPSSHWSGQSRAAVLLQQIRPIIFYH